MENKYKLAGWLAITSALLIFPEILLGILLDIKPNKLAFFTLPWTIITTLELSCSVYATFRFKHLLNERFNFHQADTLILLLIYGGIVLTCYSMSLRVLKVIGVLPLHNLQVSVILTSVIILLGIPLAIIGVMFGLRLLKLENDLGGYRKPIAYVNIVASVCFATVILVPVGMLLNIANNFMLGLVFLKGNELEAEPEFV